jgi:hypothetical protein
LSLGALEARELTRHVFLLPWATGPILSVELAPLQPLLVVQQNREDVTMQLSTTDIVVSSIRTPEGERFSIIWVNSLSPNATSISSLLSEADLRLELAQMGLADAVIVAHIQRARHNSSELTRRKPRPPDVNNSPH